MQLHLHYFWSLAAPHGDAQWGEAFQVQPMQQSLHRKAQPRKTSQNSHDVDSGLCLGSGLTLRSIKRGQFRFSNFASHFKQKYYFHFLIH